MCAHVWRHKRDGKSTQPLGGCFSHSRYVFVSFLQKAPKYTPRISPFQHVRILVVLSRDSLTRENYVYLCSATGKKIMAIIVRRLWQQTHTHTLKGDARLARSIPETPNLNGDTQWWVSLLVSQDRKAPSSSSVITVNGY